MCVVVVHFYLRAVDLTRKRKSKRVAESLMHIKQPACKFKPAISYLAIIIVIIKLFIY